MRIKTTAEQLERLASWGYLKQMANGSWASRPEESHPRALPDPCMNLSIHTAPDVRPFPWHSCQ